MSDYTPPSAAPAATPAATSAEASLYARLERQFQPKGLPNAATPARPSAATPAAPTSATAPAPAPAALSLEQRLEKLYEKSQPSADAAKPTADVAKPAADAQAKPADAATSIPDFLRADHPDTSLAAPVVRELNLDRAATARLEQLHQKISAAQIERQSQAWAQESSRTLAPADIRDAQAAFRAFGSPELAALLDKSGLGNSPAVLKAFAKALRSNPYRF